MIKLKGMLRSGRTGLRPREHKENIRRLKEKKIARELRRISRFKRLEYKIDRLIREIREYLGLGFDLFSGDAVALHYILKLHLCTKEELKEWWAKRHGKR